jgi:hypothetical protein
MTFFPKTLSQSISSLPFCSPLHTRDEKWEIPTPVSEELLDHAFAAVKKARGLGVDGMELPCASRHLPPGQLLGSRALGKPPFVLSTSVFFAIKQAILTARRDQGDPSWFEMPAPGDGGTDSRTLCGEADADAVVRGGGQAILPVRTRGTGRIACPPLVLPQKRAGAAGPLPLCAFSTLSTHLTDIIQGRHSRRIRPSIRFY